MKTEKIYYGAAYYAEYLPYDRVEKDMQMMEKAGMNLIRIAESTWSTLEPQEGVFNFSYIDHMIEAAARHNIDVIVGTPTYAIPTWLVKKYPDILALTKNGQEIYGHRQNMDITHPGYLKHCEIVIRKLIEHVAHQPNVIGYQLDNETKSYGTAGPRAQEMFVSYIKENWPDIEDFNHEFGLDYWSNRINTWEDFPDVRGTINQSLDAEYRRFSRKLVTDFLAWQANIVNELKRPDQFTTQNFDYDWVDDRGFGLQPDVDQYEAAKALTLSGCDIYHLGQSRLNGVEIAINGNIARSLKKENYFVLETQAQGLPNRTPYPGQLTLQAMSHFGNGANCVEYWHWHSIHNAIESYWKGVLSHDFGENETYLEACEIGNKLKEIGDHIKNIQKTNRVAVIIDNASEVAFEEFPTTYSDAHGYNHLLHWICDSLYMHNIEFDMLSTYDRNFATYDYIFAPGLYSASEDLLDSLKRYVAEGGNLIATYRFGFADEYLKIRHEAQPYHMTEVFGLHYDQFTMPDGVSVALTPELAKKASVCESCASEWIELLNLDTATNMAAYSIPVDWSHHACVAKNHYQNGNTLYIGARFDDEMLWAILEDFFKETGAADLTTNPNFPIIVKEGTNDYGKMLTYVLNYSGEKSTIKNRYGKVNNLMNGEMLTEKDNIVLAPWGVAILEEC